MDGIIIKEAGIQDADALGALEYRTFDITGREYLEDKTWWRNGETVETCQQQTREFFQNFANPRFFAAWQKDRCMGGVWFWALADSGPDKTTYPSDLPSDFKGKIAQLGIMVDADHLRQGIGRQLMTRALEDMKSSGYAFGVLVTNKNNTRASKFYEATGWYFDGPIEGSAVGVRYAIKLA